MTRPRRTLAGLALALALTAPGCGFKEGLRGGDPLLGNFPRPVAPTPPVGSEGATVGPGQRDPSAGLGGPTFVPTGNPGGSPFGLGPLNGPVAPEGGNAAPAAEGSPVGPAARATPGARFPSIQTAANTPAALAGGLTPRADASDLRIAGRRAGARLPEAAPERETGTLVSATADAPPPWVEASRPATVAPVGAVTPVQASASLAAVPVVGPDKTPQKPPRAANMEEAAARLKSHGALWQKLEQSPGGDWNFSCVLPNETNQLVNRRYEARDPDKLTAVQLVLDQIFRDRGK